MSTKQSPKRKSGVATGKSSGSFAGSLANANQDKLEEIQLARLSTRLRELDTTSAIVRAFGDDPEKYASQLARQFDDLSAKRRNPIVLPTDNLPVRLAETLATLADFFNWWKTVVAPNATVGLVQTPRSTDTSGGIGGEIYTGDIALLGEIYSGSTQEQWWVNTWQYVIPLPQIPSTSQNPGSLSYRFTVGASLGLYRQDFVSGSVHVYATVATTNDLANHPIDFSQPVSSDFAIAASLPTSASPPIVDGSAKVTGSIALVPGGTPAIGIIVGLVLSVAKGNLQIIPGEFSLIELTNPDAKVPADIGKIEYRRDQPFWVEAVAKVLALQP